MSAVHYLIQPSREVFAAEIYNSVWKHVVRNWDGPDAKAFAGIYKSNWVCSVVHLDLQISPRIFEKFEMTLKLLSEAWGKMIHEKNQKQKIS